MKFLYIFTQEVYQLITASRKDMIFFTVSLSLFRHRVESMLRFDPSCEEARPVETEFDGADQGIYSVKL